jgi:hypothetical protein
MVLASSWRWRREIHYRREDTVNICIYSLEIGRATRSRSPQHGCRHERSLALPKVAL